MSASTTTSSTTRKITYFRGMISCGHYANEDTTQKYGRVASNGLVAHNAKRLTHIQHNMQEATKIIEANNEGSIALDYHPLIRTIPKIGLQLC